MFLGFEPDNIQPIKTPQLWFGGVSPNTVCNNECSYFLKLFRTFSSRHFQKVRKDLIIFLKFHMLIMNNHY